MVLAMAYGTRRLIFLGWLSLLKHTDRGEQIEYPTLRKSRVVYQHASDHFIEVCVSRIGILIRFISCVRLNYNDSSIP
jgi:hypothetical protein